MSSTNEIKLDKRNYRKHNDENKRLIKKSLEECGTGRSIVIDNDNEVICGNGVFESAKELGIPVKVIETTGDEVIAIKRTDLNRDDETRDKLAILDNSTTDLSEFNYDLLKEDFEEDYLNSLGIELKPEKELQEKPELEFTEELLEAQNYIVLTFDNECDWMTCCELLDVKTVKTPDSRKGYERSGVGRVFRGERFLRGLNAVKD